MDLGLGQASQWGQFWKATKRDPVRDFADSFLNQFKQGLAMRLAEEHTKREEQRRTREQKAMEEYRNLQTFIKGVEMREQKRQYDEAKKFQEKQWTAGEPQRQLEEELVNLQKKVVTGTATPEEKARYYEAAKMKHDWEMERLQQQLGPSWYRAMHPEAGEPKQSDLRLINKERAKVMDHVGKAYYSSMGEGGDKSVATRATIMYRLNSAESAEEAKQIWDSYKHLFPETVVMGKEDISRSDFLNLTNWVRQYYGEKTVTETKPTGKTETSDETLINNVLQRNQ